MFEKSKKYWLISFIFLLVLVNFLLIYLDLQSSNNSFKFVMLDVGQGDALFIESPTGNQVLIDGGPPRKILTELSKVMSPFDRQIDAFIISNPDQDHIGGFLDVLKTYEVKEVFEPGTLTDSKVYQNLKNELKEKNIPSILAKKGMKLDLGGGVLIEVLFPDRDVSAFATNDGSLVARLSYRNFSIMLTGDSTIKTEKIILENNSISKLKSTVLKVGHHGSRTSSSEDFVKAISPLYSLISDGKDNKYGHPHQNTLDTLSLFNSKILRTDLLGTIFIKCAKINECEIN